MASKEIRAGEGIKTLKLSDIRLDGGTQPRAKIDMDTSADYAERMQAGEEFPAVDVFFDGKHYWLGDGFHRFHGRTDGGFKDILANVHIGTVRDAILFSCQANRHHGLRRTAEDKRGAVLKLLQDEEWSAKSDRWIADAAGVSHPFVASVRSQVETVSTCNKPPENKAQNETVEPEPKHYVEEESQEVPDRQPPKPPAKRKGKDGKSYPAKPAARATKPPKPARGQPTIDVRRFEKSKANVGKLVREMTDLKEHAGGAQYHETIRGHLNKILETLDAWKKHAVK